ncbi:methyltransferase family protein [Marinomonas gallaica]|uniref:methyltransferase family protein n=1 Tax=Marinomonas gallaica TaxID=1806667 RepID=UPI003A8EEA14
MDSLELKIPPALLFILTAAAMWASAGCLPAFDSVGWFLCALGWLSFVVGGLFCVLGVLWFVIHQTTPDPRDPSQSSTLVTSGIYSKTRNPMYLGFVLLLSSYMFWQGSPLMVLYIAAFVCFLTCYQIIPEERILGYRFGQTFQEYTNRVPRWW